MSNNRSSILIFTTLIAITLIGCASNISAIKKNKVKEVLVMADDWVVLSRPNALWSVGTVIDVSPTDTGKPTYNDIGTVTNLNCFPEDVWIVDGGVGADVRRETEIDRGMSFSTVLGISDTTLADVGISIGGEKPTHRTILSLSEVSEERLDSLKAEEYIRQNYDDMSITCRDILTSDTRFIVDKVFLVKEGRIEFESSQGAKVDLSLDAYKSISSSVLKTGYSIDESGAILISGQRVPLAVRHANFSRVLTSIGEKGTKDTSSFSNAIGIARRASTINYTLLALGLVTVGLLAELLNQPDPTPAVPEGEVIFNLSPPWIAR